MVRSVQGGQDLQPRPALPHRLHQDQRGRPVRPVGRQLEPFGLQPAGPQTAQQVGQPLRPVAQGKSAAVPGQAGGGAAQTFQAVPPSIRAGPPEAPLPWEK